MISSFKMNDVLSKTEYDLSSQPYIHKTDIGLYVFNVVCAAKLAICRIALVS